MTAPWQAHDLVVPGAFLLTRELNVLKASAADELGHAPGIVEPEVDRPGAAVVGRFGDAQRQIAVRHLAVDKERLTLAQAGSVLDEDLRVAIQVCFVHGLQAPAQASHKSATQ